MIGLFESHSVHVLGMMVLDTTDSAIIRMAVDDPERAREILAKDGFAFTESKLVVVEVNPSELKNLMTALLEAELNIHYPGGTQPAGGGHDVPAAEIFGGDTCQIYCHSCSGWNRFNFVFVALKPADPRVQLLGDDLDFLSGFEAAVDQRPCYDRAEA